MRRLLKTVKLMTVGGIVLGLLLVFWFLAPTSRATACLNNPSATDLVSAPSITGFGSLSGACNNTSTAALLTIKNYADLKKQYYENAKSISSVVTKHPPLVGNETQANIPMATGTDHLYYIQKDAGGNGNLTIDSNMSGTTGVVFVDGDLNINANFCYSSTCPSGAVSPSTGVVFVVQGNVYIDHGVTRVDAIIISSGFIYTASSSGAACTKNAVSSDPLVVNGSLISIYKDGPQETVCTSASPPASCPIIVFCRDLGAVNSTTPAELIKHQVKYLVLLRKLVFNTIQRWSEIQ